MKLLLLHPLPLDGSIFGDDLHALVDDAVAPTLYCEGDDIVHWARASLDAVGEGELVVVGSSIGGSCAVEVARLAPTKVRGLVLCGAKPGHRPEPELRDEVLRVLLDEGLDLAWERYWRPLFGPGAGSDVIERGWQAARCQGPDQIASGVRAFHGRPDRHDFLLSWTGRVAVVTGEHDIKPERARSLAADLPDATFHRLAGVGHYIPLEAPDQLRTITAEMVRSLARARR